MPKSLEVYKKNLVILIDAFIEKNNESKDANPEYFRGNTNAMESIKRLILRDVIQDEEE